MPFGFGRKPAPEPEPEPEPAIDPAAEFITGDRPCDEHGCARQDAAPCGYVDRRGRHCPTAFCPEHQAIFDGGAFCRRHVGTLRAIGLDIVPRALAPDLENRAPSLVNWICNDLDGRVRALLMAQVLPGGLEELGEERVHLNRAAGGVRRWDRSWKLFDHTGVTLKVTVSVNEDDDTTVIVRVGQSVVTESVPPWIERRLSRIDVSPEQDADERRAFYDHTFDRIAAALARERDTDPMDPLGRYS